MANNYDSWKISVSDFEKQKNDYDKLVFLLEFGTLAPSSHNSQPWEFQIDSDNLSILFFKSKKRTISVGDPNDTLSYISIGCAIENVVIAADYFGYKTDVTYDENHESELCATLKLTQDHNKSLDNNHLIFQINKRLVNRGKYEAKLPPDVFLKKIERLSFENCKVVVIQDSKTISSAGEIANNASIKLMDSQPFRNELSSYVKNNFTKSYVGIPAFGMQINNLLSLVVPTFVRIFNMDKLSKKQNMALFSKHTPIIVVITSKEDAKKDKLISGRIYQKIALYAMAENIKTSPWGSASVHNESRKKLQILLNTDFYPEFLFRMGYNMKDPRHSPRLLVDKVIKK